jgi:Tol biopolymer transport system component
VVLSRRPSPPPPRVGLSPTPTSPATIDLSSLGGRIAFSAGSEGIEDIYVVNPDGTGLTRLTRQPGWDFDPSWSPGCSRIAFRSERDGQSEIYVMNADGSQQTNLTKHPGEDLSPAWSPDGTSIAFASYRASGSSIRLMDDDGSNQRRLGGVDGEYPACRPTAPSSPTTGRRSP